jgi:hypothetical protein
MDPIMQTHIGEKDIPMACGMGRIELHSGFCWENLRETSLCGSIKLKQVLNE